MSELLLETAAPPRPSSARRDLLGSRTASVALAVVGFVALVVGAGGSALPLGIRLAIGSAGAIGTLRGTRAVASSIAGRPVDLGFWLAAIWLLLLLLAAVFADMLPLGEGSDVSKTLLEPTLVRPDLLSDHPLGTDRQGLDILSGVVYGARVSLMVGLGAVAIGTVVGGAIGLLAGFYRGWLDRAVSVLSDSMMAFPPLVFLMAMVAVLQPSARNVTIALGIISIPSYIRLVRANVLTLSKREFVLASRALAADDRRIVLRELLPNVVLPVVSYGFVIVAVLIVSEATLSFLGLSIQRPNPTWGNLIAAGQSDFDRYPHLVFGPGAVLFATVFALNRVGDRLRLWWEPRSR